jgi:hypothetical protein
VTPTCWCPWCAGVELSNGTRVDAQVVLVNADPFRLRTLAGPEQFSTDFNTWLESLRKDGTTMKVCRAHQQLHPKKYEDCMLLEVHLHLASTTLNMTALGQQHTIPADQELPSDWL